MDSLTKNPLISIIMNCFNGEKFLRDSLESILMQTYQNWELIFWDNQSTDKSAEIFSSFKDVRFKYFFASEHTSLFEARNFAIEKASGEYFAFLDVDDWWDHEKLEKQSTLFEDPEVGLVFGNYWFFDETNNVVYPLYKQLPNGNLTNELLKKFFVGTLTIMIRKKALESIDEWFSKKYQFIGDFDLVLRISKFWKFDCVQKPIAYYRFHGENASIFAQEKNLTELSNWRDNMRNDSIISKLEGFKNFERLIEYQKAIYFLGKNDFRKVWEIIKKLSFTKENFRLCFKIIIPRKLFLLYLKFKGRRI